MASQQQTGRAASIARRQMQVNGKSRSAAASANIKLLIVPFKSF